MKDSVFISVAVTAPLDRPLTYALPSSFDPKNLMGSRVLVPLGSRKIVGIVMGEEKQNPSLTYKPVESVLDPEPLFSTSQLQFIKWASDYYLVPLGEMFKTALPLALTRTSLPASPRKKNLKNLSSEKEEIFLKEFSLVLTPAQEKIKDAIAHPPPTPSHQNHIPSPLAGEGQGEGTNFSVHLIHGITGSGKTEIYLSLIHEILKNKKQALCLVPEIALTPQTVKRYTSHFGTQVKAYHSDLSESEKLAIWRGCQKNEIPVLIGTRSALFAPFKDLGLIIIDEEQDASYKQEERVRYHARDLAIVRAKIEKIPILLGSATPSVETYFKAREGKYFYHELTERYGPAQLPKVEVVDLKTAQNPPNPPFIKGGRINNTPLCKGGLGGISHSRLFSLHLLEEIEANLARKEQTLIFLNRRGFSHFLLCKDCGETPTCSNCDITLTFHQGSKKLLCHYCDHQIIPPTECTKCKGTHWLPIGSGTERIEEDLKNYFPDLRMSRMDRDTTTRKGSHHALLEKLSKHEIDLLVGTQMIAKGHDYPLVTLVGVLSADTSLHHPDFRAAEQTFQLITQVAGRAGRASSPGRVLLQTFSPDHYAIQMAAQHQIHPFYKQELEFRKELEYPPFKRLLLFRIQGTQKTKVIKGIGELRNLLEKLEQNQKWGIDILGPSPCLIEKVRNVFRWQILIKCPLQKLLQPFLREEILNTQAQWLPKGLRLVIDVDPLSIV